MNVLGTENESLPEKDSLTPANELENNEVVATTNEVMTEEQAVVPEEAAQEEALPEATGDTELSATGDEIVAEEKSGEDDSEESTEETTEELPEVGYNEEIAPANDEVETTEETTATGVEETAVENEEQASAAVDENLLATMTKEELVQKLKDILKLSTVNKSEVDAIKQAFYKKHKAEQSEMLKKYLEDGGEKDDFEPKKDPLEEELKQMLTEFRNKKAAENLKLQQDKEKNMAAKTKIVEQLKAMTEDLDGIENVNEAIATVRNIQQEWKNIGPVPQEHSNELWKNYQLYIEKFYDYVKISNELREYDLKKNLELKTAICEQAEKLDELSDIQTAFRVLQALHEEWKETGPVVRELREEIWERMKKASSVINKKHQDYFEGKKEEEEKNLTAKTGFCEQIEAIDCTLLVSYKDWEEKTKEIIDIQAQWKQTGFAPKKVNVKIYERFRKACDEFFRQKNEFFQKAKDELNENLNKKIKLCEQAEALKDSTDWKETSDKMIKIQKEWKTIGAVPRKHSDAVWKRFIAACDYFFEQKEKSTAGERLEQEKNLELKKEIIAKIEALDVTTNPQEALQQLKNLIAEWNGIGFVPFKEKDKTYKAFKRATDAAFDQLKVDEQNRRLHMFKSNIEDLSSDKSNHKLFRERDKLKKEMEHLNSEISTYENNIGFFSSSKKADKLIKDMEKKIEKLKDERGLILKKISMIEDNLEKES